MKKKIIAALACASVLLPALLVCQNSAPKVKEPIVRVGKTVIGKNSLEMFEKMARIYPQPWPYFFPIQRQPITFMAESEAIYQYTKSGAISEKIKSSLDWAWKKKYFTAALFFDLLGENMGFTDAELEVFYKKSPEKFRVTVQTDDGQDSSFIPPFETAKGAVAETVFYEKYKPDSAFLAKLEMEKHSHDHDSATVRGHWLYSVRTNPADFYMRRFFYEQTGNVYESASQIYDGKENMLIQSNDIDVIRSWISPSRRNMRMNDLIEWLYKWQTFADRAEKLGLTSKPNFKDMLHWASRVEYALAYLRDEVLPNVTPEHDTVSNADANLVELLLYDQAGRVEEMAAQRMQSEFDNIAKIRISTKIDSAVYDIRKSVGVVFLQDTITDEKGADPALLIAKADSLREVAADMEPATAGKTMLEAENIYRTISMIFGFTAEGRRAMSEFAKLMIDRYVSARIQQDEQVTSAIASYRRGQILETDTENLCNSFFMIGFAYDEYLKKYALAEANYRWILRNAPACALASDAEFMLLHLDEPMTSIDEIQGQSQRQGRTVDFDDETVAEEDVL